MDAKRLHIAHEMLGDTGQLLATAEQLLLHVDTEAGKVAPFPGGSAAGCGRSGTRTRRCRCRPTSAT